MKKLSEKQALKAIVIQELAALENERYRCILAAHRFALLKNVEPKIDWSCKTIETASECCHAKANTRRTKRTQADR